MVALLAAYLADQMVDSMDFVRVALKDLSMAASKVVGWVEW